MRQTGASPLRSVDPGQVGPYVPLALLGSGGMGRVYLARPIDDSPGLVAVKVIRPEYAEDVSFRRRFEREASVHAKLRTPHTPRLCGTGFRDELLWMATEYLPGFDLAAAVREDGALETAAVWRLMAQLGQALADLAEAGIVHRDLKPSNVLLTVRGAHVIDFGISKAADASAITGTGNRVGTPAYMSPEHLRTGTSDAASDVFALAGTLVYAAAGRAPFGDGTGVDVMHRVAFEEPDAELIGAISATDTALGSLLSACLTKDPERRPTAQDLIDAAGAHSTDTPSWPEPLDGKVRARQRAYEALHRLPAERGVRFRSAGGVREGRGVGVRSAGAGRDGQGGRLRSADALAAERGDRFRSADAPAAEPEAGFRSAGSVPDERDAEFRPAGALPAERGTAFRPSVDRPAQQRASLQHPADQPEAEAAATGPSAATDAPAAVAPPEPLRPAGTGAWARRKPLLAVAAVISVCVVAAGVLLATRPDATAPSAASSPGAGARTAVGTVPGDADVPPTPGPSDGPSAEGAPGKGAGGPADTQGRASDPEVPEVSDAADDGRHSSPSAPGVEPGAPADTTASASSPPPPEPATPPWISDCTHYAGNGRTRQGDSGKRVLQVQCMLTKRGYGVGSSGVDGEFGSGTESAVRGFQSDKGLNIDGIVGHETWTALREPE
ncbi:protein kinase [Streptomyces sp. NPDC050619]|uniref:protein kinase domain-containing protein n=1 Tax=Streptomyces sp. NPDC050619 TaxID=3157214 RepID=UPI0034371A86